MILFSMLCIRPVSAQLAENIVFKNFSMEQGLSDKEVKAIVQGSNGYIWIATMDGVNRYDGYDFSYYQHNPNDSNTISNNAVWSLYEDHLNNLWVGTAGGFNLLDRQSNRFEWFHHEDKDSSSISNNTIYCIAEDPKGNLWVGSYFKGLNLYDRKTGGFKHFQHNAEDSLSLSHNSVRVIYFDSQNTMWVGTPDGLNRFDHNPRTLGMLARTPHPCSRACCGNPRKYFNKPTVQERRNFQRHRLS